MRYKKVVADDLLPSTPNQHPDLVNGFTHWASHGWDIKEDCPLVILTYDPDCPVCENIKVKEGT